MSWPTENPEKEANKIEQRQRNGAFMRVLAGVVPKDALQMECARLNASTFPKASPAALGLPSPSSRHITKPLPATMAGKAASVSQEVDEHRHDPPPCGGVSAILQMLRKRMDNLLILGLRISCK
jgi:hypothetical protein